MARCTCVSILAALVLSAPAARAAEVRIDGSYRLRVALNTDLALDDQGYRLGQSAWLEHRLRMTPKLIEEGKFELQAQFDLLSGLIAGDLAPGFQGLGWNERAQHQGVKATGFDFRTFFAEARTPVGLLQLGQMPSHWGMGLVANGGNEEDAPDFGDVRFGDLVDRVLFATRPFQLASPESELARQISLALAADLVYRDRFASLLVNNGNGEEWGDLAGEFLAAARFDPSDRTRAGLYVARRIQSFARDAGNLHVWVFDAHARTLFELGLFGGATLALEGEAAQIYGRTSHSTNLNSLGSTAISQQGAVARVNLSVRQLETELEVGFASGDGNPFDDQQSAFVMNRDFKVGLVLFDEVLLFQTQNAARRLADPNLAGRPPPGVDLIPTEGAVSNALYVKPTLRFRPAALGGKVRFVGSLLWARAPEPYVDPYNSLLRSRALNTFGAAAGQSYGTELDGAISWREKLGSLVGLELGVQAGILFPGNAFDKADGSRMGNASAAKFRATVTF